MNIHYGSKLRMRDLASLLRAGMILSEDSHYLT
jgi:hypothetical protein